MKLALRLLVPAVLVGLVGWLAALEYHWLDQVSQADREQRRAWLQQHAGEFADDVDRELARIYGFLETAGESVQLGPNPAFAKGYEAWHDTARDPQILRAIYWAKRGDPSSTIAAYDPGTGTFKAVPWPDALGPIAARVRPLAAVGNVGFVSALGVNPLASLNLLPDPLDASVPAVIVSRTRTSLTHIPPTGTSTVVAVTDSSELLIAQLDRGYLEGTFLPALAARYFPAQSVDPYRVAIVDAHNPTTAVMTANWPRETPIDLRHADATQPLFMLRPELAPRVFNGPIIAQRVTGGRLAGAGGRGGGGRASTATAGPSQSAFRLVVETDRAGPAPTTGSTVRMYGRPAGWQLVLQHASGSLDVAVTEARHRNLWLSFGLLAVLSAGIVLIVTNAQRSERLATQQMEFVATVSHELRTPLAVIRSAAQNLGAGVVADPARAQQYGELIEAEGRRLTDIVEQVLEFAGISGSARPQALMPVDVGTIAADVLTACAPLAAAAHVQIESNIATSLPAVLGDERALRSAIQNLVTNALKYGADGHWLGVSVQAGGRPGPAVEVTVADRGLGIDAEDRRHLFQPFYRGRRAMAAQARGNGLGLSLVKRIAEAHGGRIRVESALGAGATFHLTLPASPAPAATSDLAEFQAGPATE
jgi:signal transduction histidine kinase